MTGTADAANECSPPLFEFAMLGSGLSGDFGATLAATSSRRYSFHMPARTVDEFVVARFSGDDAVRPYGLIDEATG